MATTKPPVPTVTIQPVVNVGLGGPFQINATCSDPNAKPQWYNNRVLQPGETKSSVVRTACTARDAGSWHCAFQGAGGLVTTKAVIVSIVGMPAVVTHPPVIVTQPQPQQVPSAAKTFTLTADLDSYDGVTIVWSLGSVLEAAYTGKSISPPNTPAMMGNWAYKASNSFGGTNSQPAAITAQPVVVIPPTSPWVLAPGSLKSLTDMDGAVWSLPATGQVLRNGTAFVGADASLGLTLYQGVIYRQDALSQTWWTCDVVAGVVQSSTDPTKVTPPPTWDLPPVVVTPTPPPPVVIPPSSGGIVMPRPTACYPQSVYMADPSKNLGDELAAHGGIARLQPGASYSGDFTAHDGWQLFGLPSNNLNGMNITIAAGAKHGVLSGITSAKVTFQPGAEISGWLLTRFSGVDVMLVGAQVNACEFAHMNYSGVVVDTRAGGYVRNCRFMFAKQQSGNDPMMVWQGDAARNSYGNVLIGRTFQSYGGGGAVLSGLGDLAFLGFDAEDGNLPVVAATNCGPIRIFAANGGSNRAGTTGFNVGCDELHIFGGYLNVQDTGVVMAGVKKLLMTNINLTIGGDGQGARFLFGTASQMSAADQASLIAMLAPARVTVPWERPILPAIPDPLGANWNVFPVGYHDSTALLQAAVDSNNGMLPPGTYYCDGTVVLQNGEGGFGAGDGKTIIVATRGQRLFTPAFGGGQTADTGTCHLTDMTIYGGSSQIDFNDVGDQPTNCWISHITFRNASVAGINVDKNYGMDNNFFDHLNFVACATAVKQTPDPNYQGGETSTMAYIDKTMYWRSQFLANGRAFDMQAKRQNNLDSFVSCLFRDNDSLGIASGAAAFMLVHCDAINNGGNPSVSNAGFPLHVAACYFEAGPKSGAALFGNDVNAEGCVFKKGSYTTQVKANAGTDYFANCDGGDMPFGVIGTGMMLNSKFDAPLNQSVVSMNGGRATTVAAGTPRPVGQLCQGVALTAT